MKLYFYKAPKKNFGDDLNAWLWPRLLPGFFDDDPSAWVSVIGTIINDKMPEAETKIVFSSGAGYEAPPKGFGGKGWRIICVRGPLTAKVLNLPESLAVTDGAILLASLPEYKPMAEKERSGVVFMPHHRALDYGFWEQACKRAGIGFVSPREDSLIILEKLKSAKLILADAMHAAIVADTLRVPWVPILASSSINGFKWHDWTMSLGMTYKPVELPSSSMAEVSTRVPLNMFGGMHVRGETPAEAYDDYQKKLISMSSSRGHLTKKARLGVAKSLRYASSFSEKIGIGRIINERLIDNAASGLQRAAALPSQLSKDKVFEGKLVQIQDKLHELSKSKV